MMSTMLTNWKMLMVMMVTIVMAAVVISIMIQ